MNSDEIGHFYIDTIYSEFKEHPESVEKYYDSTAVLTQKFCEEDEITVNEKFGSVLISGEHVIMRCDGVQLGEEITVHASGYLKRDEKYYQSNEMFVFKATSQEPLVLYQSSYFTPVEDPEWRPIIIIKPPEPKVEDKEPAPPPEPVEVQNAEDLMYNRTVLCQGLPPKSDHSRIIKDRLERYGIITKYCKRRGQILVEFENPASLTPLLNHGGFQWKGKNIKVKGMPQGYTFTV